LDYEGMFNKALLKHKIIVGVFN